MIIKENTADIFIILLVISFALGIFMGIKAKITNSDTSVVKLKDYKVSICGDDNYSILQSRNSMHSRIIFCHTTQKHYNLQRELKIIKQKEKL